MFSRVTSGARIQSWFRILVCCLLYLACVVSPAHAVRLLNTGIYISPSTASTGQTVSLRNGIKATGTISNVTVTFEIRRILNGKINPYAVWSKVTTAQNFVADETKSYQNSYVIPAALITGTYAYVIRATNADLSYTYLTVQGMTSPYIFNVNGRANATYLRGINIMDMDSGKQNLPGVYNKDYTKPSLTSLQHLRSRGLQVVRIPFLWERLQPTLGGSLNAAYLGYLMQILKDSNTAGLKVILDMHNYGRYTPTTTSERVAYPFGHANGPTQQQYADAWQKLSTAVRADPQAYAAVYAYDIMNEPHDLIATSTLPTPQKVWEAYSQAAVSGIRALNDSTLIHVEGYAFASALNWPIHHPTKWINDPLNNIMYQAHLYLDNDVSGRYAKTHAEEVALAKGQGDASIGARGIARVKRFGDWLAAQNVPGFVGELGWPNSAVVGSANATAWNKEGDLVYNYLDTMNIGATQWATGSWISATGNILNVYELPYGTSRGFSPLSSAPVLEAHLGN